MNCDYDDWLYEQLDDKDKEHCVPIGCFSVIVCFILYYILIFAFTYIDRFIGDIW